MSEAQKRRDQVKLDEKSIEPMRKLMMEDYKRFICKRSANPYFFILAHRLQ